LSENASALPCHLSMGLGIKLAVQKTKIPTITHDHDFAWERGDRYVSPHKEITELVTDTFPLRGDNVKHAVINLAAQKELRDICSLDSVVVPNVMDFDVPYGANTKHNEHLPSIIGLDSEDIALFQVTRIVRRKGIDTAINLVKKLDDKRIKLVITGSFKDDENASYYRDLREMSCSLRLEKQVIFAANHISSVARPGNGDRMFGLSDAYSAATACTYFSTYEGFGNAFVEAVCANKPIFVNNYKPVYWPDIGSKGFRAVMLEDSELTDNALKEISSVIHDKDLARDIAEHNFNLGKEHFSYQTLELILRQLID